MPENAVPQTTMPTSGRMKPAISQDTEFFWRGARERKLLIQRCADCQVLRHPPGPACPSCHSFEWDSLEASGRGTLHSYVIHHHPPVPGFDGPVPIALVDLDEGVRLLANINASLDEVRIGQRVVVGYLDQDDGWTVPQFEIDRTGTLPSDDVREQ